MIRTRIVAALVLTAMSLSAGAASARASGTLLTVNTTGDLPSPCSAGSYSLRCAIDAANADGGGDTIDFSIPSSDPGCIPTSINGAAVPVCTIYLYPELPTINAGNTVIDGYSQPGASPNTNGLTIGDNATVAIHISGAGCFSCRGLKVNADGVVIRGLSLTDFFDGITLFGGGATIQGNYIGLKPDGTVAGNLNGVVLCCYYGGAVRIGGTDPSARNVISGNGGSGIYLDTGTGSIDVEGNYIGTTPSARAAAGNGNGLSFYFPPAYGSIGGTASGSANIISGNSGDGVAMSNGYQESIAGNDIGTDATGTAALPNGKDGIEWADTMGTIHGNVVANNKASGVLVEQGLGPAGYEAHVSILRNSTYANGGLGIDLAPQGVVNCSSSPPGPNGYTPCPTITSAMPNQVSGTACPACTVEAYLATDEADDQGFGEGRTLLGTVTADGNGNWSIGGLSLASGQQVTASATSPAGTSEFAANIAVQGGTPNSPCVFNMNVQCVTAPSSGNAKGHVVIVVPGVVVPQSLDPLHPDPCLAGGSYDAICRVQELLNDPQNPLGTNGNSKLGSSLTAWGMGPANIVPFSYGGFGTVNYTAAQVYESLDTSAKILANYVRQIEQVPGVTAIDLIGHSMGGAIIAYSLHQNLPTDSTIHRAIAVDSPLNGIGSGDYILLSLLSTQISNPQAKQDLTNSTIIAAMQAEANDPRFYSVTNGDDLVVPWGETYLGAASRSQWWMDCLGWSDTFGHGVAFDTAGANEAFAIMSVLQQGNLSAAPTPQNTILGACPGALTFILHSPATTLVTDPNGNKMGYDPTPGSIVNQVPGAQYTGPSTEPQMTVIPNAATGHYAVALTGTGSGAYTIDLQQTSGGTNEGTTMIGTITTGQQVLLGAVVSQGHPPVLDATPPVITPTITGTLGSSGWYTSDVTVSWSVTDPESVVSSKSGCDATSITTDTAGTTLTCTATSAGGTSARSVTIKRDATPPTVSGTPDRPADHNGWYNHQVTVTWSGGSDLSGIAGCDSPTTYSGPDSGTAAVTGHCTNGAGLVGTGSFSFQYDATKPAITASLSPQNAASTGWYNSTTGAPSVSFTCSDATSGIDGSCPASHTFGEGANQSYSASISDKAGNSNSVSVTGVNVDLTPPSVSYSGNAGPYTVDQTVNITCTAADTLSGIASTTCKDITGPAYSFSVGNNAFSASATDKAGNTGSGSTSFTVQVTYGSLCTVTKQFIQSSAKYQALPPSARAWIDQQATALCQYLSSAQIALTPAQKAAAIALYQKGVAALVPLGWLTQPQADTLTRLSSAL